MKKKKAKRKHGPPIRASHKFGNPDPGKGSKPRDFQSALESAEKGLHNKGWSHDDCLPVLIAIAEDPYSVKGVKLPKSGRYGEGANWVRDHWLQWVEGRDEQS